MRPLMIRSGSWAPHPGDFGSRVADSEFYVSADVATALESLGVRNSTELLSYLETFPSAIAAKLGWTVPEVQEAAERLKRDLDGHVEAFLLRPTPRRDTAFGALDPANLKRRSH